MCCITFGSPLPIFAARLLLTILTNSVCLFGGQWRGEGGGEGFHCSSVAYIFYLDFLKLPICIKN